MVAARNVAVASRTAMHWTERVAAHGSKFGVSACYPGTTVCRCTLVIAVPVISTPLPNIAVHVIESKSVGWKSTDVGGLPREDTVAVCQVRRQALPKMKRRCGASPTGVFPLSFAG